MKGIGQSFDDFMKEQGLYQAAQEVAAKKVSAFDLKTDRAKSSSCAVAKLHITMKKANR
jgi:hypothetical protein